MCFISVKISDCRALNTQKRRNRVILAGYDVIGAPGGSVGKHFEKIKFGHNFHLEKGRVEVSVSGNAHR